MTLSDAQQKAWTRVRAFYVFLERNPRQVSAFLMYALGIFFSFLSLVSASSRGTVTGFLVLNERIHDVYWQSLLLLLTILIPVSIETFKFLEIRFQKLGKSLYLYEVVKVDRFYTLVPLFTFTFIFSLTGSFSNGQLAISSKVLIFFHTLLLFLWIMMFWYIFELLVSSIRLLADSGSEVYVKVIDHLKNGDTQLSEEGNIENWRIAWNSFGLVRNEWREKILSVFWIKINSCLSNKLYGLANNLIADFAQSFLDIEEQKHTPKDAKWLNERMRWLWFHEKKFSDDKENSYSVYVRMLELHAELRERREGMFSKEVPVVFESGLDQLYRTVKSILENLTRDELKNSSDGYYGLFRILREHTNSFIQSKNEDDKKYVESIPMYRPVFEHADSYTLQQDAFPEEWQLSAKNLEKLIEEQGDGRFRLIWLNQFLNWSNSQIGHDKKEYDSKLEGALEMLFPKMQTSWLAYWMGFKFLPWGGERVESLCHWERNFGFLSSIVTTHWSNPQKTAEENDKEMMELDRSAREESRRVTANLLVKFRAFGSKEEVGRMKLFLENLRLKYADDSKEELNRLQLIELFDYLLRAEWVD